MGREFWGIDLNEGYPELGRERVEKHGMLEVIAAPGTASVSVRNSDTPLFAPELQALPHSESTEEASSASSDL